MRKIKEWFGQAPQIKLVFCITHLRGAKFLGWSGCVNRPYSMIFVVFYLDPCPLQTGLNSWAHLVEKKEVLNVARLSMSFLTRCRLSSVEPSNKDEHRRPKRQKRCREKHRDKRTLLTGTLQLDQKSRHFQIGRCPTMPDGAGPVCMAGYKHSREHGTFVARSVFCLSRMWCLLRLGKAPPRKWCAASFWGFRRLIQTLCDVRRFDKVSCSTGSLSVIESDFWLEKVPHGFPDWLTRDFWTSHAASRSF